MEMLISFPEYDGMSFVDTPKKINPDTTGLLIMIPPAIAISSAETYVTWEHRENSQ